MAAEIDARSRDARDQAPASGSSFPEVSVVIPCLNEAETVAICVSKAQQTLHQHDVRGEVILADNGSTDGSQAIAIRLGARVVRVEAKGYGNALMGGIAAAHGKFIIMGDADDSYDFLEIPAFLAKLLEGFDLVQGCRLPSGGKGEARCDAIFASLVRQSDVLAAHKTNVPRADPRCLLRHARFYQSPV
jgi:glycosyltransferase involved in cell wall biosynthesis